jgi:hypothetical protein
MVCMLWREPFNHDLEEISNLTLEQLVSLARKEISQNVQENDDGSSVAGSYQKLTKEQYAHIWKMTGKTDDWIDAEWRKEYGDQQRPPGQT